MYSWNANASRQTTVLLVYRALGAQPQYQVAPKHTYIQLVGSATLTTCNTPAGDMDAGASHIAAVASSGDHESGL